MHEEPPLHPAPAGARKAIVIGAGLGGLSTAIHLAHAGWAVTLLEASEQAGGKAGTVTLPGGVVVDTGPSVLTLPEVLDPLLAKAGMARGSDLRLVQPEPAFRYRFMDGTRVDLHHDPGATVAAIAVALGSDAGREFASFLDYSRRIWDAAAPRFVYGAAPGWRTVLSYGLPALFDLPAIDPLRGMQTAIRKQVRSPHLRMILGRYATYNGSDLRRAPATLNCIAHVELSLGGYGIAGGVSALVDVLVEATRRLGVDLRLGSPVAQVLLRSDGRVRGVRGADGQEYPAEVVVNNADAAWLRDALPPDSPHGMGRLPVGSMSGWNAVIRAQHQADRPAHEVLFCTDYDQEFADIFDRDQPPAEPTLYLCAQARAHGRKGWPDAEPLFIMANAPPEPTRGPRDPAVWTALEDRALTRLRAAALIQPGDAVLWRRSPGDLAARFPGSRGSLYGAASNDPFAAFRRPPTASIKLPGLYLASGSAHLAAACRWPSSPAPPPRVIFRDHPTAMDVSP